MYTSMDYIYEVYRERSFTKAAKKLFVTQPALSASVRREETELGTEIFDRRTSPVGLTEAGEAYIQAAEQIYAVRRGLKERIDDLNGLKTGKVAAGGTNFVSSCVLPEILKTFTARYPGIRIDLTESSSEELKQLALSDGLDVVIDYDFDPALFEVTPIREERIFLSAAKGSPQARKFSAYALTDGDIRRGREGSVPAIDVALLGDERFILLKKGNDMYDRAADIFREGGVRPNAVLCMDQLMTSYALASKGLGMAFVPDTLICAVPLEGAVYFRLQSPHARRTLAVARKKNRYASKALACFLQTAAESFSLPDR